jgi:hypothetical protein
MKKQFSKLRSKMLEYEIDQNELSEMLGRCIVYVSQRFTGKRPWDLTDMYKIMDEFKIPYEQMHEYFPKNGKTYVPEKKPEGLKLKRAI